MAGIIERRIREIFRMTNGWNHRMGPRGPLYGHRGFGPGGLFFLPALFFGGRMIIAVIGGLLGLMAWIPGGAFPELAP